MNEQYNKIANQVNELEQLLQSSDVNMLYATIARIDETRMNLYALEREVKKVIKEQF